MFEPIPGASNLHKHNLPEPDKSHANELWHPLPSLVPGLAVVRTATFDAEQAESLNNVVLHSVQEFPPRLSEFVSASLQDTYDMHVPKLFEAVCELGALLEALHGDRLAKSNSVAVQAISLPLDKLRIGLELIQECEPPGIELDEWRVVKHDAIGLKFSIFHCLPSTSERGDNNILPLEALRRDNSNLFGREVVLRAQANIAALVADAHRFVRADPDSSLRVALETLPVRVSEARESLEQWRALRHETHSQDASLHLLLHFERFSITLALIAEGSLESARMRFWHDVKLEALGFIRILEQSANKMVQGL